MRRSIFASSVVLASLCLSGSALAIERRFTYNYESRVLNPGDKEIELWTTPRIGREDYYLRFDNRAELELGLTERLQTSVYLNFTTKTVGAERESEFEGSLSNEWKYKLLDPSADVVGLALYGEGTAGLHELEVEAKLLLDKRFGDFLAAINLVGEHEWEFEEEGVERAIVFEQTAGVAYFIGERFSAGFEAKHHMLYEGRFMGSALYVGPTVSYAAKSWWLAATFSPQVASILPAGREGSLELDDHERFIGRVLLGFHI
jgi:hypothetical protein